MVGIINIAFRENLSSQIIVNILVTLNLYNKFLIYNVVYSINILGFQLNFNTFNTMQF